MRATCDAHRPMVGATTRRPSAENGGRREQVRYYHNPPAAHIMHHSNNIMNTTQRTQTHTRGEVCSWLARPSLGPNLPISISICACACTLLYLALVAPYDSVALLQLGLGRTPFKSSPRARCLRCAALLPCLFEV